jgi:hypothetical protein
MFCILYNFVHRQLIPVASIEIDELPRVMGYILD